MTLAQYIRPRWAIHTSRGPVPTDADVVAAAVVEDTTHPDYRCPDAELFHRAEARAGHHGEAVALVIERIDADRRHHLGPASTSYSIGDLPW